jgi:2'-5' RNA ligase
MWGAVPMGFLDNSQMDRVTPNRRLFVAIMAGEDVATAVQGHRRQWTWPQGVRLTDAAALHTTLHFLGEVAPAQEVVLTSALHSVPMLGCDMRLSTATVWAGGIAVLLVDHDDALARLRAAIGLILASLGMRTESRAWVPHLTLARHAQGASPPTVETQIEWRAKYFSLVWSRPAPLHGYMPVATWPSRP